MVVNFNKEMFFQLSCFWPPQEVKRFAEKHDLLADIEEKRSRNAGKSPEGPAKNPRADDVKQPSGQSSTMATTSAPPKAARNAPPKAARGNAERQANVNKEGLTGSNQVLNKKMPEKKTLADIAKGKSGNNPFEDDSTDPNNPFLDGDDNRNPFEEKEAANPFLDNEPKNPFGTNDPSNPFLD